MPPVDISLVVCTRNRARQLPPCLQAIAAMEGVESCQVIVVDNGSTDATRQLVTEFAAGTPRVRIEYVHEARAGLSRARNRGLREVRAPLVLFTDDDCYPDRSYLREARNVFADPAIHYFGGRVLLHDPSDARITIQESTERRLFAPFAEIVPGVIHGANMGFRRRVFEQVGGFNVLLGAGTRLKCAEDTELIARASAVGLAGGYFPEPTVSHHHGRKESDADALMRGYDVGRGAFFVAMARHRRVRIQYLKRWYWSLAWNRKARFLRELGGACRFIGASMWATLARRNPVPKPPAPAVTGRSAGT